MNWFVPLRRLLLAILVVFSVLIAVIQFFSIVRAYTGESLGELENMLRYSASSLATNLEFSLARHDPDLPPQFIRMQAGRPHLLLAAYADRAGRVTEATDPGQLGRAPEALSGAPSPAVFERIGLRMVGEVIRDTPHERMWAIYPVRLPPESGELRARGHGLVILVAETGVLRSAAVQRAFGHLLTVLLPLLLLAAVLAVLVKWLLTDRIEQLLAYTRSQAEGLALPAPVTGRDELGQLGSRLDGLMREVLESRDFHVRVLERLPNPIWRTDAGGRCEYVNAAWVAFTAQPADGARGEGWLAQVHPADRDAVGLVLREALAERRAFSREYRLQYRDGSHRWVVDHGEPLYARDGVFLGYLGSCFDVQQEKDAARAIAVSEGKFRGLVELSLVGIYLIQAGRMVYANPCLSRWFGYAPGELDGTALSELVHPEDLPMVADQLRRRLTGEAESAHYEFRARRRDGGFFPVEVFGARIDVDGVPTVIGTLLDITQRQADQAALLAARDVVEASPTVLFRWRNAPGWPVLHVSQNVARWGCRADDMIARAAPYLDMVHPDDRQALDAAALAALAAPAAGLRLEYRLLLPDGREMWVEENSRVVLGEDGQASLFEGLVTDITARKQADERIRRLNAELEERVEQRTAQLAAANKELETFAYSVSHDLKAPLRGIDGYSHLLLDDHAAQLDAEGRLFVSNIRAGVAQMARLIDDLLAYSRMERRNLQMTALPLARLVSAVLAERAGDIELRGVDLAVALDGLSVRADPDGLAQVVRNLIDNALKYSRSASPPSIRIGGEAREHTCVFWVRDNGVGFDMRFHDRIFEIFQRLQLSDDYAGTGVGLAIVRKAVQRMGGRVWAESAPGEGACFYVELPKT